MKRLLAVTAILVALLSGCSSSDAHGINGYTGAQCQEALDMLAR